MSLTSEEPPSILITKELLIREAMAESTPERRSVEQGIGNSTSQASGRHSIEQVLGHAASNASNTHLSTIDDIDLHDTRDIRLLLENAATEALARAHAFGIPRNVPPVMQNPAQRVEEAFVGVWPILKRAVVVLTLTNLILITSVLVYGLFYIMIMPGPAAVEPLFFDYAGISNHPAPVCTEQPVEQGQPAAGPSGPWAVADFFARHSQWEAFHDEVLPRAITTSRILKERKAYFFEVALELPESDVNRMNGMFAVHVELQSSSGRKLASSIRSSRLPHESTWIGTVRKSIWLGPLVIGAVQETRRVVVPSFRHYVESSNEPLQYATVKIARNEDWKTDTIEPLEVIKGEIRIGRELSDFQFMLREWFFTCYAVGTIIIAIAELILYFALGWYWRFRAQKILQQQMEEEASLGLRSLNASQLDDPGDNEWEQMPRAPAESGVAPAQVVGSPSGTSSSPPRAAGEDQSPPDLPIQAPPTPSLRPEYTVTSLD